MSSPDSAFRIVDLSSKYGFKLLSVIFDLPGEKVNKFSKKVMSDFEALIPILEQKVKAGEVEAIALSSGKPGNFIAGADIELIRSAETAEAAEALARSGQILIDRWEDLGVPKVVLINGAAMGGGCEISLASDAIVMSNDPAAKIGLPEVLLGIIPGMGGCVRLPRKIGIAGAFDLILTGKTLNGERAAKAGLAEACLPKENFEDSAYKWIRTNLKKLRAGERIAKEPKLGGAGGVVGSVLEKTPMGRMVIFKKAREGVLSKTHGQYPSPLEAVAVLHDNGAQYGEKLRGREREKAMMREARGFGKVAATSVSKNLIRIFFMTETVKKSKGAESVSKAIRVDRAAVLGAGVMGGGIAQLLADKGVNVRMKDLNTPALAIGVKSAMGIFSKSVKRKRITSRQMVQKLGLIAPTLDYSGFKSTELVVEAVLEKMDVKKKVLAELETNVSDQCVIASNTSSLSITEMQTALQKPARFVGMHFFNPVSKMPLIEVIRGAQSSDEAVSLVYQFSKQIGKTPIVVKDAPGFLVNRLLMPYLNEATWLLSEGVPIPELDSTILEFGMPMGPMELIDEVGVDVGEKVAHILHDAFGDRMLPAPCNAKVASSGRLGKKSGKGIYVYEDGGKKKVLDESVYELLGVKPKPGSVSKDEILDRCILPMINEASRCLKEKIVATAEEIDLGMIMGTGFPPFRGGLLRYADGIGAKKIVEKLQKYSKKMGARYEPSPELIEMAEKGLKFYP